ncbi:hypothetical protein Tco_0619054, partial [Tanacetum coccineum]
MAHKVDYSFMDTVDASIQDSKKRTMAAIEVVNLRVRSRLRCADETARSPIHDSRMHRGIMLLYIV